MSRSAPHVDPRGGVLFVYGTLKRGYRAHFLLEGAEALGPAQTAPSFRLIDLGNYPGLVPGDAAIEGELYRVSDRQLRRIDAYEGSEYRRTLITLEDGRVAESYWLLSGRARAGSWMEATSWRQPATLDSFFAGPRIA